MDDPLDTQPVALHTSAVRRLTDSDIHPPGLGFATEKVEGRKNGAGAEKSQPETVPTLQAEAPSQRIQKPTYDQGEREPSNPSLGVLCFRFYYTPSN
jgi:hypothetical protein